MNDIFVLKYIQDCIKISSEGMESRVEIAYIRGSQVSFIVLPDTLAKAPFFNRIKMWRKFRGHAVYGANTAAIEGGGGRGRGRGTTIAITPKTQGQLKRDADAMGIRCLF